MAHRLSIALKIVAFLLGCAFAVVAAFAFYVWFSFDTTRIEAEFVRVLGEHSQRTLKIDGGLHLSLWPRPALRLHAATVSEQAASGEFIRLGDTRMVLALQPLLLHRVVIEQIDMDGGQVTLNRRRDGSWNYDDLMRAWDDDPAATQLFRLERVQLVRAALHVRDEGSGFDATFNNLQFASGALQAGRSGPLTLLATLKASNPTLDGSLQLGGTCTFDAHGGGTLSALTASLAGRAGDMTSGTTWLSAAKLDWNKSGAGWRATELALSLRGNLQQRPLDASVKLPQLAWADGAPRAASLAASVDIGPADAAARDRGATQRSLQLQIDGIAPDAHGFAAQKFAADWQVRSGPDANTPPDARMSVNGPLHYDSQQGTLRLDDFSADARFASPRLSAAGQHVTLTGSARWRVRDSGDEAAPIELAVDAALGQDSAHLEAQLNRVMPLTGTFTLTSKQLDADALLASAPANATPLALPLEFLRQAKLDGQVHVDALQLEGVHLTKLQVPLTLAGGRLAADAHSFALYGGNASGDLAFDTATQQLDWKLKVQKLDTAALAQDNGITLPVNGRADGSIAIDAHGADSRSLAANLQRVWQLHYALPVLTGADFAQSLRALRPAWRDGKTAMHRSGNEEKTELASLDIVAHQQGRRFDIDSVDGRASWLTLAGKGQLDLASGALTLDLQATPTHPEARSFARDLVDLRGVAMPLQLQRKDGHTSVMLAAAPTKQEAKR